MFDCEALRVSDYYAKLLENMAAKPIFTKEQKRILKETALRIWEDQFKGKRQAQEKMGLALGISQQTVSSLLKADSPYNPSLKVAKNLATLAGRNALEELIGIYGVADEDAAPSGSQAVGASEGAPFANLTVCIQFHASTKHWSPWTIAAARAGFFGNADFAAPEWAGKLDHLEKALERARKT